MRSIHVRTAAAMFVVAGVACSSNKSTMHSTSPSPTPAGSTQSNAAYVAKARADSARLPYTEADIQFMSGMIHHHAQAIAMAKWAPTHGASPGIQRMCERIINAQGDEINIMSNWLRDRNQPVPVPSASGMKMTMNGMEHTMLMPGMLSEEQMKELDAARGTDFDKLFLKYMIQHHKGALQMVTDLQSTEGAGQDELTFKLTSDVYADQSTEIDRMEKMLVALTFGGRAP
jgi:uncharacterized protein (DUF305 family)